MIAGAAARASGWLAGSRKAHAPIIVAGSLRGPHARFGCRRRPIRSTEDPVHATPSPSSSSDLSTLVVDEGRISASASAPAAFSRSPAAAFPGGLAACGRETWGPAAVLARVVSPWGACLPGTVETSTCAVTPALLDYLTLSLHSHLRVYGTNTCSLRIWCCGFLLYIFFCFIWTGLCRTI